MPDSEYYKKTKDVDRDVYLDIYKHGVLSGLEHSSPSPQTIERFEKLDQCLQELTNAIKSLETHSIERGKKVDEMYEYFVKGGNVVWFIKWIFGSAAAVGGLIIMAKSIIDNGN